MKRRQFLKLGSAAAAAGTLGPAIAQAANPRDTPKRIIQTGDVDMTIRGWDFPVIDGNKVYVNFFELRDSPLYPVIWVREGTSLRIRITNDDDRAHRFAVTGLFLSNAPIQPGQQATYSFRAPPPGSYIFYDPTNDPVSRLLGLNGALIVLPALGTVTPARSPIPYNRAQQDSSAAVRAVFDAMGNAAEGFPGNKWDPDPPEDEHHPRDIVWLASEIDPVLNNRIGDGHDVDASTFRSSFLPRYFTVNFVSGFETARHEDLADDVFGRAGLIEPEGYEGQPTILRTLNAGICTHSMHIHGNEVFELTGTNSARGVVINDNIFTVDTWQLPELGRKDMLLPFNRPADIPDSAWPPTDEKITPDTPLRYVMHDHCEMSQTAGGGNYPQGMVTHWEMIGTIADYKKHKGIS